MSAARLLSRWGRIEESVKISPEQAKSVRVKDLLQIEKDTGLSVFVTPLVSGWYRVTVK